MTRLPIAILLFLPCVAQAQDLTLPGERWQQPAWSLEEDQDAWSSEDLVSSLLDEANDVLSEKAGDGVKKALRERTAAGTGSRVIAGATAAWATRKGLEQTWKLLGQEAQANAFDEVIDTTRRAGQKMGKAAKLWNVSRGAAKSRKLLRGTLLEKVRRKALISGKRAARKIGRRLGGRVGHAIEAKGVNAVRTAFLARPGKALQTNATKFLGTAGKIGGGVLTVAFAAHEVWGVYSAYSSGAMSDADLYRTGGRLAGRAVGFGVAILLSPIPGGAFLGIIVGEGLSFLGEWVVDLYLSSMTTEHQTLLDRFVCERYGIVE
jgi:hypothetical protein